MNWPRWTYKRFCYVNYDGLRVVVFARPWSRWSIEKRSDFRKWFTYDMTLMNGRWL